MQWVKTAIAFFSSLKKAKFAVLFAANKLGFLYAFIKHTIEEKKRSRK